MWKSVLAVSTGAAIGAVLRWQLNRRFDGVLSGVLSALPLGTLCANLLGAYLAGLFAAALSATLPAEWRLLAITGFCGGLTTFSSFSLEIAAFLQQGKLLFAGCAVTAHLAGSIVMTFAGMATAHFFKNGL